MYLYLLNNKLSNKFYIGITKDLSRRLNEHNLHNDHYTGKFKGHWELKGYRKFEDIKELRREEIRLKKSKNKKYIFWYFNKFGFMS